MLRGMLYVELTLKGPSHDLHSGMYGGAVTNPNNALARIIAASCTTRTAGCRSRASTTMCARSARPRPRPGAPSASTRPTFLATAGLRTPVGEKGRTPPRAHLVAPDLRRERDLGRLYRRRCEDRDPGPGQRQALLPPRARPGPGEGAGGPQAVHRAAPAARLQARAAGVRQVACHPRPHQLALSPRRRAAPPCTVFGREPVADRLRRLDPGRRLDAAPPGPRHAVHRLRPRRRPRPQPEREVRAGLLRARHPHPRGTAWPSSRPRERAPRRLRDRHGGRPLPPAPPQRPHRRPRRQPALRCRLLGHGQHHHADLHHPRRPPALAQHARPWRQPPGGCGPAA